MADAAVFTSSSGRQPDEIILEIRRALVPEQADLLYAGQRQNERIHEKTEHHVDVDGNEFEPYDTVRPYYFRPWDAPSLGRGKKNVSLAARRARVPELSRNQSAARFLRKLGGTTSGGTGSIRHGGAEVGRIHAHERDTIRFASYAAFKASLGRSGVDLTGPHAPHMMQAIQVSATDSEIRLSIEDPAKAAIATGHNTGETSGHKKRRFFGASDADVSQMLLDIYTHIKARNSP
jgi:hypothetical protein